MVDHHSDASGEWASLRRYEEAISNSLYRQGLIEVVRPEVARYLGMSPPDVAALPPDELGTLAYALAQYAFYLQTLQNRLHTRASICRSRVEALVGHKIADYGHIYGREDKWHAAVAADPSARRWRELQEHAQREHDRLAYLTTRLDRMSQAALQMQSSLRKIHAQG
jgi:hypothetical protein